MSMHVYVYIYMCVCVWVFSIYLYIYICNIFRVTTYGVMWCVVNAPDLKWLVQPVHFRTTRRISSAPQPHESGVAGTLKDIIVEWGASWNSWDCSGFHGIYIYIYTYIYFIPFLITLYLSFFLRLMGSLKCWLLAPANPQTASSESVGSYSLCYMIPCPIQDSQWWVVPMVTAWNCQVKLKRLKLEGPFELIRGSLIRLYTLYFHMQSMPFFMNGKDRISHVRNWEDFWGWHVLLEAWEMMRPATA